VTSRAALGAAILGATLVVASCGVVPPLPSDTPAAWIPTASPSPLPSGLNDNARGFTPMERAAVRVRNDGCDALLLGSGFILDAHTIVTNHHVVASYGKLTVNLYDGTDVTVTGSSYATNGDLGLITTKETLVPTVSLAETDPSFSDAVTVAGYPEGGALRITDGTIFASSRDALDNASIVYRTSAEVKPGSSGSAAYDAAGNVFGVIYAGIDAGDVSVIIPVSILRKMLDDSSLRVNNPAACPAH
jgi:S1-C subfamily serine protease